MPGKKKGLEPSKFMIDYLRQLIGKTVTKVAWDGDEVYGLEFSDGTLAWIMQDPEGNGPGHLDITKG